MSMIQDCPGCANSDHALHVGPWNVRPGLIGGAVCECKGDCAERNQAASDAWREAIHEAAARNVAAIAAHRGIPFPASVSARCPEGEAVSVDLALRQRLAEVMRHACDHSADEDWVQDMAVSLADVLSVPAVPVADSALAVTLLRCSECEGLGSREAWDKAWWQERGKRATVSGGFGSVDDSESDEHLNREDMVCPHCAFVHDDSDGSNVDEVSGFAAALRFVADSLDPLPVPAVPVDRTKQDKTAALFAELHPDLDWNAFSAEAQATWIDGLDAQGAFDDRPRSAVTRGERSVSALAALERLADQALHTAGDDGVARVLVDAATVRAALSVPAVPVDEEGGRVGPRPKERAGMSQDAATRTEALKAEMRRAMYEEAVALLGSGYVPDYYESAASGFIALAEWYAVAVAAAGVVSGSDR